MHRGASIDGYMYDTYLYDNPDLHSPSDRLKRLDNFEDKFFCEEGSFDGIGKKASYKNVSPIRAALKLHRLQICENRIRGTDK